jgi:hypothetical protein
VVADGGVRHLARPPFVPCRARTGETAPAAGTGRPERSRPSARQPPAGCLSYGLPPASWREGALATTPRDTVGSAGGGTGARVLLHGPARHPSRLLPVASVVSRSSGRGALPPGPRADGPTISTPTLRLRNTAACGQGAAAAGCRARVLISRSGCRGPRTWSAWRCASTPFKIMPQAGRWKQLRGTEPAFSANAPDTGQTCAVDQMDTPKRNMPSAEAPCVEL